MADDIWALVHPERNALIDDLSSLSKGQWESRSLCQDWTIRDTVAHLTASAMATPVSFVAGFARSGFSFGKFSAAGIARHSGASPEQTLDRFREAAPRTTSPPGPKASWVGEVVVHGEDIRRPLRIRHPYAMEAVRRAADMYVGSNALIGAKRRIAGVRLEATDTDWAAGDGPRAEGPLLSLVMVMTGRQAFLDELDGEGVAILRSR